LAFPSWRRIPRYLHRCHIDGLRPKRGSGSDFVELRRHEVQQPPTGRNDVRRRPQIISRPWLGESIFCAGLFFTKTDHVVQLMRSIAPVEHIFKLPFPILFLNGSEDNRDSEDRWLEACTRKKESKLKVYDGGDHFFAHDSRFVVEVIHSFVLNNKD
jgi:hypothetical protein